MNRYRLKILLIGFFFIGGFSASIICIGGVVEHHFVLVEAAPIAFVVAGCYGLWLGNQVWKKEKLKQLDGKSKSTTHG